MIDKDLSKSQAEKSAVADLFDVVFPLEKSTKAFAWA